MTKEVMIMLISTLANYIIVNSINSQNAKGTENVIKFLLGETKQEILSEIKEATQHLGKELEK